MNLFEITTALGVKIVLDEGRWKILVDKHPDMVDRVEDVRRTLLAPDTVRFSKYSPSTFLYYRREHSMLFTCVVVRYNPGDDGFIATTYRTDRIKAGIDAR